jgi:hypothetical protein
MAHVFPKETFNFWAFPYQSMVCLPAYFLGNRRSVMLCCFLKSLADRFRPWCKISFGNRYLQYRPKTFFHIW